MGEVVRVPTSTTEPPCGIWVPAGVEVVIAISPWLSMDTPPVEPPPTKTDHTREPCGLIMYRYELSAAAIT